MEEDSFIKEESNKLLFNEKGKVDAFIKGLRSKQYRSHFLVIQPSTIEEVRRTVIHITRRGQYIYATDKKYKSDITSSSCSESNSNSDSSSSDSDSSIEEDFIKMKSHSHSNKKHAGIH